MAKHEFYDNVKGFSLEPKDKADYQGCAHAPIAVELKASVHNQLIFKDEGKYFQYKCQYCWQLIEPVGWVTKKCDHKLLHHNLGDPNMATCECGQKMQASWSPA